MNNLNKELYPYSLQQGAVDKFNIEENIRLGIDDYLRAWKEDEIKVKRQDKKKSQPHPTDPDSDLVARTRYSSRLAGKEQAGNSENKHETESPPHKRRVKPAMQSRKAAGRDENEPQFWLQGQPPPAYFYAPPPPASSAPARTMAPSAENPWK
eukprot:TRINITY_DN2783_c0_g1::TRINITY_DN2783_c0_g1_i1::g.27339::m.27339 TRINITY_DN2783_c0_g1::TRINITY_DN2783_c0_g1_i1::g.27339  ORF type:complete len:153 (+),score=18.74,Cas_GSU0054/PF09609.5/0.19,Stm1_N/PF09598.5/2.7e+02,Stm1_N/PF09598.5/0.32 TRINITY_DN2783_c0_g1_i1:741-1199(+)